MENFLWIFSYKCPWESFINLIVYSICFAHTLNSHLQIRALLQKTDVLSGPTKISVFGETCGSQKCSNVPNQALRGPKVVKNSSTDHWTAPTYDFKYSKEDTWSRRMSLKYWSFTLDCCESVQIKMIVGQHIKYK